MRKVFLENLPKKGDRINWKESIGYKVPFVYDDIEGEIKIIDYITKDRKLVLKYNNEKYTMTSNHFIYCKIGNKILNKRTDNFRIAVNGKIIDEKRDFIILNHEYRLIKEINRKWYKYRCNKCGNEDWMIEGHLLAGNGCPVCANQKAVLGINTIWDTDRWMCNLGVSKEDAKKYTHSSSKTIMVRCPDCGKEKKTKPYVIYDNKSIFCSCGGGKSYPEKFIIELLNQLSVNFETEYSPSYIKPKRYDFYIKKCDCIIETHGRQHYKENTFKYCGGRTLEQEQANDNLKRNMALSNGIKHYIELDCRESEMEYIKNSILNSELSELFDLSNINWTGCAEFANKNIVKEVCDYWNDKGEDENIKCLCKIFKLSKSTITNYLKKGTKLGWCNYDPKEEIKKCGNSSRKAIGKKVEIFKDNKSLGIFESCAELSRQSERLFGCKLLKENISSVCRGVRKQYKNYIFKYV
ncbi:hypothetical protein ACRTAL_002422 [Clostridium perfringens]